LSSRKNKAPTILDVADLAGVSVGSVSRYLNGEQLRRKNRESIAAAIEKLSYSRNTSAANIRRKSSGFIGFLLPSFDEFHTGVLEEIVNQFTPKGYVVLPFSHGDQGSFLKGALEYFKAQKVDAIIASGDLGFFKSMDILQDIDVPLILYSNDIQGMNVDRVLIDDRKASKHAVKYMIEMGHTNIAILTGDLNDSTAIDRKRGYEEALASAELTEISAHNAAGNGWHTHHGYIGTLDLYKGENKPTAIFASNYFLALGAVQALEELDLKIPSDVSIISFGDASFLPFVTGGITAVSFSAKEIGKHICDFALSRITDPGAKSSRTYIHQPSLVVRTSVSRPQHD
jgi:LacI family transcriptional regulator